jgi:prolyl-tRNA synthetase
VVLAAARGVRETLDSAGIRVRLDDREGMTPGFKFNDWEMRGVPLRIEIGPRDVAAGNAVLARRDRPGREGKASVDLAGIAVHATRILDEIQLSMLEQARAAMAANTRQFSDYDSLRAQMEGEGGGGLADVYWCGRAECETKIRDETRATCRAIPLDQNDLPPGPCIVCGEPSSERAFFAKAY